MFSLNRQGDLLSAPPCHLWRERHHVVSKSFTNSTGQMELPRVDQPQAPDTVGKLGKTQGAGRKFLDRLKSYSRSQISSQSLNVVHIYRLQPKSATKSDFFLHKIIIACPALSIVSSTDSVHVALWPVWLIFPVTTWRFLSADTVLARQSYSTFFRLQFFP